MEPSTHRVRSRPAQASAAWRPMRATASDSSPIWSAMPYSPRVPRFAPNVLVVRQSTPASRYPSCTDLTMSGRVTFSRWLEAAWAGKWSRGVGEPCSMEPIAPSATSSRSPIAALRACPRRTAAASRSAGSGRRGWLSKVIVRPSLNAGPRQPGRRPEIQAARLSAAPHRVPITISGQHRNNRTAARSGTPSDEPHEAAAESARGAALRRPHVALRRACVTATRRPDYPAIMVMHVTWTQGNWRRWSEIELDGIGKLTSPAVIAAFEGWNDAGEAASGVINHLASAWHSTPVGAIDPEDFYDFQVTRPVMEVSDGRTDRLVWPTSRMSLARPDGRARELIRLHGIQPNMRWRAFRGAFPPAFTQ